MRPPRALPTRLRNRQAAVALSCAVLTAGAAAAVVAVAAAGNPTVHRGTTRPTTIAAGGEITRFAASGSVTVQWRGNGHGHGMSQYGARGAALQGLSAKQILAFYYPHTTLTRIPPSHIRVSLSNLVTPLTTVLNNVRGLTVTGYPTLPAANSRFRLAPDGNGLVLQALTAGGRWKVLRRGLAATATFSSGKGWVQLLNSDGTSSRYYGTITTVRSGSGELTVNRVRMDQYVKGSVPLEVSASWPDATVQAQAIAARSYAEVMRSQSGSGSLYDICDTSWCQSYGGMARYDRSGNLIWQEDPAALAGNQRTVLHYQGRPVFAQYAASNGGATVSGGTPYLVGRTDPYDGAASGDPYLNESKGVRAASIASSYGLKSVTSIEVTRRDGNGPWGGRVLEAYVNGRTASGKPAHIATTGDELGSALGVWTDYLRLGP
jgi:peptidoglycan hydrolase-like amidase